MKEPVSSSTPILEARALTKRFGDFTAVDDVSFVLHEGEILGLLGQNGAGKTTTIQMLLGILTPTSGEISCFGKPFAGHREEILEQVSFSSNYTNLPWNLTVRENLTFISYFYQIPNRAVRLRKIIDIFRLGDIIDSKTHTLSSGQLTRVNLAKAFLNFPRILLLDEPTASLDPEAAQYIRQFLLEERQQFRVSIILTSHNMAEVEEVCDRVIFINEGKIIADDTPEVLARSVTVTHVELFVGDHLGAAIRYAVKANLAYRIEGKRITIDAPEKDIPDLLRGLMRAGVVYEEIAIDRPTLEDYFLATVKNSRTAEKQP